MAVQETTSKTFQQDIAEGVSIVRFTAPWCGPCKSFKPIFLRVAEFFSGVKFFEVDSDSNRDLEAQYNVRALPTCISFKDGKLVGSAAGAMLESKFTEFVSKAL